MKTITQQRNVPHCSYAGSQLLTHAVELTEGRLGVSATETSSFLSFRVDPGLEMAVGISEKGLRVLSRPRLGGSRTKALTFKTCVPRL